MAQWVKNPVLSLQWLRSTVNCCDMGSIPGPETSTCCGCSQEKKKKKKKKRHKLKVKQKGSLVTCLLNSLGPTRCLVVWAY